MKFKDMDEKQQDAFKNIMLIVLNVKTQEEQKYTHEFFRLLVLGNGAGIALLATFMGALIRNNSQIYMLRTPLILFFIGACLAAAVYFPLASVAYQATNNIHNQINEFFLNN